LKIDFRANLLPEDKVAADHALKPTTSTAMVGDGIKTMRQQ